MPSKKRRTKRRAPLAWGPILWGAFGLNLAIGLLHSPLTKARIVRVEGATPVARPAIQNAIQSVRGQASAQVNIRSVESRVLQADAVETVSYSQNLFGRGLMKVKMRTPVARIDAPNGDFSILMDASGSTFRDETDKVLPLLRIPTRLAQPTLSVAASWQAGRIAELCEELSTNFREKPLAVEVTERGVIQLRSIDGGASVVLGSSDGWKKKLTTLRQMLAQEPDLWKRYSEINLTDPGNPMTTQATR